MYKFIEPKNLIGHIKYLVNLDNFAENKMKIGFLVTIRLQHFKLVNFTVNCKPKCKVEKCYG